MVVKILLVLPVVLVSTTNWVGSREGDVDTTLLFVQSGILIVVMVCYAVASTKSRPFIKDRYM